MGERTRQKQFETAAAAVEIMVVERDALELAWMIFHGTKPRRNRGGDNPENRFVSMLECGAFESAALSLRPEGCSWTAGDLDECGSPWAVITACDDTAGYPDFCGGRTGCSTAVAIAAAALRAEGSRKLVEEA